MKIPTVFISSTSEDLKPFRQAARDAAVSARFHPEMMEYFAADGQYPPLEACRAKVREADVIVTIVAHRYGWLPDPADSKNITWLECDEAIRTGKEVLAFLAEGDWPAQFEESYRITEALKMGKATAQLLQEIQCNIARLAEFKQWLNGLGIRATFSHPDDLGRKVEGALREWRERHREFAAAPALRGHFNPGAYLRYLREQTAWIDIRGLQVGTGRAYRFPIEELYIPLTTYVGREVESQSVDLEEALEYSRLVVVGDPGSGKTTFLRHLAYLWCCGLEAARTESPPFPILIRIGELIDHIRHYRGQAHRPSLPDSPEWLIDFLNSQGMELNWELAADFFREKLVDGSCVLLLDGLDEAPGKADRESIVRLFENATGAYRKSRFVSPRGRCPSRGLLGS
jgi:predicted NACHT family NTPase